MKPRSLRILAPLLFAATSLFWLFGGLGWVPRWISSLGERAALTPLQVAQLAIGALAAAALSMLLFGGGRVIGIKFARFALVVYAFCCVATMASNLASTGTNAGLLPLVGPAIGLALSLAIYYSSASATGSATDDSKLPSRKGGSWVAAGALAIWVIAIGIAVRLPLSGAAEAPGGAKSGESLVLDYITWQGRTLPDTGLSRLLPKLTALTLEGRCIVVLYSPECSHCRELFEQYFAVAQPDRKVIAVEIPPAPGTIALTGDNLGPIPCDGCEHLSLPAGKHYILKPPTVLVTEGGRVVCATDSDWKACLGDPPVSAANTRNSALSP